MSYLLLPGDEAVLVEGVTREFGLIFLASALAPAGKPKMIASPAEAVPGDLALPAQPHQQPSAPIEFFWWCSEIGPIKTLGDAPPSDNPRDRVAELLNREATDDWRDLIDLKRTPVIRYSRSGWHDDRRTRMRPGALRAMAMPVREQPDVLDQLHARIVRWMQNEGERLDPFDHCSDVPIERPSNTSQFSVWAWPEALAWVRGGGEIWPWTG